MANRSNEESQVADEAKPGVSYIVPTFDEEDAIGGTIERLHLTLASLEIPYEIIVVNDGSSDRTRERVEQYSDVKLINHPINIGYGNALKSGILCAQYAWIGIIDADGSYPVEDIPNLVREMHNGFDMVIGARQNTKQLDGPIKRLFRAIYKTVLRVVIKDTIEDANSGFRMFRREIATNHFPFLCGTFSFTTSLTILAMGQFYFVKHIPIQYLPRHGSSKVRHLKDSIRTLQYIVQGLTFYNPIKFFMILTLMMMLLVYVPAMGLAMFSMLTLSLYYVVFGTTVIFLVAIGVLADIVRISLTHHFHQYHSRGD